ncbi:MAG TPA: response regulator transcription factor [Afifellaceae bacterium]|nr:response regulator transcription factor [Afifellaceae bacterium]
MTTVLIADDHPIVLEGLVALLQDSAYAVVARCVSGDEVIEALQRESPDILVLDLMMPGVDGLEIARRHKNEDRPGRIVLLTSSIDADQVAEAIRIGVRGLVLKESAPRQLVQCLDSVRVGDEWIDPQIARLAVSYAAGPRQSQLGSHVSLTPRELEVTRLVVRGLRNREIGEELAITEGTVKMYLHNVYEKLEVKSRMELAFLARSKGLV